MYKAMLFNGLVRSQGMLLWSKRMLLQELVSSQGMLVEGPRECYGKVLGNVT